MVDFSGAVNEPISLETGNYRTDPTVRDRLFSDLLQVYEQGGIISCSIAVSEVYLTIHLIYLTGIIDQTLF